MSDDALAGFQRIHLERLKLAADVLLSEAGGLPAPLEAELLLYRERVEHALLQPPAVLAASS
jgi:hypothetical protein